MTLLDDPTDSERDLAAQIIEDYIDDVDLDRIGELIADVATAFAHIRVYGLPEVSS